jgi:hypothetical protein
MTRKQTKGTKVAKRAINRIASVRASLANLDYVCSGTLVRRMMMCGQPTCRCKTDPEARHGPYYQWGRMRRGKLVNRMIAPEKVPAMRQAIANYRTAKKLLRTWETETERLIDSEGPDSE